MSEDDIQRHISNIALIFKDPEKPRVLSFDPTGLLAVNIGKTTIYSGLATKPRTNLNLI